jgi:cell division septum initiation protein DivIVA
MLALAQKLHDEYVRNGEQTRDRIVGEAREHAHPLMREAEEKQRQTLGSLEQERSLLERKIDELRAFEREYRSRLKSYLEGQLRELEAKAAVVPNRGPAGHGERRCRRRRRTAARCRRAARTPRTPTRSRAPQYPFGGQS